MTQFSDNSSDNTSKPEKPFGIAFEKLFSSDGRDVTTNFIKHFIDRAINKITEKNTNPDKLVRVVSRGKILWMTIDQANEFLASNDDPDLKHDIEEALRGNITIIRNEIKFLLALAYYTLEQYRSQDAITQHEYSKLEPELKDCERAVDKNIYDSIQSEMNLKEKRNNRPLLEQYEELMAKFIRIKDKPAYHQTAAAMAEQLQQQKSAYLRYCRAIEPDIQRDYESRMNLQVSRKNIMNTQNNINASRQENIRVEINDLKEKLLSMDQYFSQKEPVANVSAESDLERIQTLEIQKTKKLLEDKEEELQVLDKSSEILTQQQNKITHVVKTIKQDILKSSPKVTIKPKSSAEKTENESHIKEIDSTLKKEKHGMYSNHRRKK